MLVLPIQQCIDESVSVPVQKNAPKPVPLSRDIIQILDLWRCGRTAEQVHSGQGSSLFFPNGTWPHQGRGRHMGPSLWVEHTIQMNKASVHERAPTTWLVRLIFLFDFRIETANVSICSDTQTGFRQCRSLYSCVRLCIYIYMGMSLYIEVL